MKRANRRGKTGQYGFDQGLGCCRTRLAPLISFSLDVSCLTIFCRASKCTPSCGLWRHSVYETSRNWPPHPAFYSNQLCFLEWAIATVEIRFKDKTDFNIVLGLACHSSLEVRHHVRIPANTTSLATETQCNADNYISRGNEPIFRLPPDKFRDYECCIIGITKRRPEEKGHDCRERGCG